MKSLLINPQVILDWSIVGTCLWIGWQDLQKRQIHVGLLFTLALIRLLQWTSSDSKESDADLLLTLLLISAILTLIWSWAKLKGHQCVWDHVFGWGDVVMLLILGLFFTPGDFIWFYSWSTLLISMGVGVLFITKCMSKSTTIPLAGLWAIALAFSTIDQLYNWQLTHNPFSHGIHSGL